MDYKICDHRERGNMTVEDYYKILKERWEKVDKDNLKEIQEYNRFAYQLRKEMASENDN